MNGRQARGRKAASRQNPAYRLQRPVSCSVPRFAGSRLAEITPFRGIRYNDGRYPDLSPVLAPPYDVISAADLEQLLHRSNRNVARLILGEQLPGPKKDPNKYALSATLLDEWLIDETLIQDRVPAVYLLDQEFEVDGERKVRRAFIARLRIEAFGKGCVFPHEETMPGPKADRLALMRATRMNTSQIFGLYSDDGAAQSVLDRMAEVDPAGEGTGIDGVKNVVRVIYHPGLIKELAGALADKRIIVADGHHRYETAVAYRAELRVRRGPLMLDQSYEFVSVALVSMTDPGLAIHATHRLVSGVKGFAPDTLFDKITEDFDVEEVGPDGRAILSRLAELADRHALGIVTGGGSRVVVRKSGTRGATGSARDLDTHILHHEIFGKMLMLGPASWRKGGPIDYVQNADECIAAVSRGDAQLAALVNPTRMDEVEAIALAGGKMPPKSTFFYPKLPTGIVINPLI